MWQTNWHLEQTFISDYPVQYHFNGIPPYFHSSTIDTRCRKHCWIKHTQRQNFDFLKTCFLQYTSLNLLPWSDRTKSEFWKELSSFILVPKLFCLYFNSCVGSYYLHKKDWLSSHLPLGTVRPLNRTGLSLISRERFLYI